MTSLLRWAAFARFETGVRAGSRVGAADDLYLLCRARRPRGKHNSALERAAAAVVAAELGLSEQAPDERKLELDDTLLSIAVATASHLGAAR